MKWQVILSRRAAKDAKKIAAAGFKPQTEKLLRLLEENPFQNPPHYEKLVGSPSGNTWRIFRIRNGQGPRH